MEALTAPGVSMREYWSECLLYDQFLEEGDYVRRFRRENAPRCAFCDAPALAQCTRPVPAAYLPCGKWLCYMHMRQPDVMYIYCPDHWHFERDADLMPLTEGQVQFADAYPETYNPPRPSRSAPLRPVR